MLSNVQGNGVSHVFHKLGLTDPTVGDCLIEVDNRIHSLTDCTVKDFGLKKFEIPNSKH